MSEVVINENWADEYVPSTDFSGRINDLYLTLESVTPQQMGITPDKSSALVTFMQNGLRNLGHSHVVVDGVASPAFLAELNGFIAAKRDDKQQPFPGYMFINVQGVKAAEQISGAHLGVIIDSLRDNGMLSPDKPEGIRALTGALPEIKGENRWAEVRLNTLIALLNPRQETWAAPPSAPVGAETAQIRMAGEAPVTGLKR